MRQIAGIGIVLFLAVTVFAQDEEGSTVLTTPAGQKILLNKNNTWTIKSGPREIAEDFTVQIKDGRFIQIGEDGTWGFVEKEVTRPEDKIKTDSIMGRGSSSGKSYDAAAAAAEKQALDQVTAKMKIALKNIKTDATLMPDCVRRVEKDIDRQENFKEGVGWSVTVIMRLDRGSILAVADCCMHKPPAEGTTSQ